MKNEVCHSHRIFLDPHVVRTEFCRRPYAVNVFLLGTMLCPALIIGDNQSGDFPFSDLFENPDFPMDRSASGEDRKKSLSTTKIRYWYWFTSLPYLQFYVAHLFLRVRILFGFLFNSYYILSIYGKYIFYAFANKHKSNCSLHPCYIIYCLYWMYWVLKIMWLIYNTWVWTFWLYLKFYWIAQINYWKSKFK